MEAVAAAFDEALLPSALFRQLLQDVGTSDADLDEMCRLPESAQLMWAAEGDDFPLVRCRNVFVVPGVHAVVEKCAERLSRVIRGRSHEQAQIRFRGCGVPPLTPSRCAASEGAVAASISALSLEGLSMWTVPGAADGGNVTRVILVGDDRESVLRAVMSATTVLQRSGIHCAVELS